MENQDLYEIVYASVANKPVSGLSLRRIGDQAARLNADASISSLLIYFEMSRRFVQILEGPKDVVERTMEKIEMDSRHERIHVLWQGGKKQRSFPDWAMSIALGEKRKIDSNWSESELPEPHVALNKGVYRGRGFDSISSFCAEYDTCTPQDLG